jgi:glycosyltransferase involved in cell wall biosynthesis
VALHPADQTGPYPTEVRHRIRRDVQADYTHAALALNDRGVDVVAIQHDSGMWGGDDGAYILDFARALRIPAVVTLHSIVSQPTPRQRQILGDLIEATSATVVMSRATASLLAASYGVDPGRTEMIPHGVPHLPLVAPDTIKPRLGVAGRPVILSFGLLGPDKGYEAAIAAMPAVIKAVPSVCYVILGATHPGQLGADSEAYRAGLETQVASLGLAGHVRFVDGFVGRVELATWLEAADLFVTPYPNLDRTVSGTLAYAMAAGRAIVSTPYAYAAELLGDGRGKLVAPNSQAALAEAITELLRDPEQRASLGRRAYEHSRAMVWWEVGRRYRRLFDRLSRSAAEKPTSPGRNLAAVVA